jgi:hypothetical protein
MCERGRTLTLYYEWKRREWQSNLMRGSANSEVEIGCTGAQQSEFQASSNHSRQSFANLQPCSSHSAPIVRQAAPYFRQIAPCAPRASRDLRRHFPHMCITSNALRRGLNNALLTQNVTFSRHFARWFCPTYCGLRKRTSQKRRQPRRAHSRAVRLWLAALWDMPPDMSVDSDRRCHSAPSGQGSGTHPPAQLVHRNTCRSPLLLMSSDAF